MSRAAVAVVLSLALSGVARAQDPAAEAAPQPRGPRQRPGRPAATAAGPLPQRVGHRPTATRARRPAPAKAAAARPTLTVGMAAPPEPSAAVDATSTAPRRARVAEE